MKDNILKLNEVPNIFGTEKIGHSVIIENRKIPKMICIQQGEYVQFILDERFGFSFPNELAYVAAEFAAQAMAIGMGYSHLGASDKNMPFAPEVMEIKF